MKLVIRESAYADLERIYTWIARDSPANAQSVIRRIDNALEERLVYFPCMGRNGKVPGTREWVVHGLPYIIVYRVEDERDELTVLAIFHGAQDR